MSSNSSVIKFNELLLFVQTLKNYNEKIITCIVYYPFK